MPDRAGIRLIYRIERYRKGTAALDPTHSISMIHRTWGHWMHCSRGPGPPGSEKALSPQFPRPSRPSHGPWRNPVGRRLSRPAAPRRDPTFSARHPRTGYDRSTSPRLVRPRLRPRAVVRGFGSTRRAIVSPLQRPALPLPRRAANSPGVATPVLRCGPIPPNGSGISW